MAESLEALLIKQDAQITELKEQLAAAQADCATLRQAVQKSALIVSRSKPGCGWIEIVFEQLADSQAFHEMLVNLKYRTDVNPGAPLLAELEAAQADAAVMADVLGQVNKLLGKIWASNLWPNAEELSAYNVAITNALETNSGAPLLEELETAKRQILALNAMAEAADRKYQQVRAELLESTADTQRWRQLQAAPSLQALIQEIVVERLATCARIAADVRGEATAELAQSATPMERMFSRGQVHAAGRIEDAIRALDLQKLKMEMCQHD